jgi:HAE1 family hydrophobic/amphiphilic exporter-1
MRPQITAEVDQRAAASYGLNAAMVAGTIRGYVAEQSAGVTTINDREAKIVYITALNEVTSAEDIAARPLTTPLGDEITIGDVADVKETDTAVSILTQDGRQYAAVSGSITLRDTSAVIQASEAAIAALDLPEGVEVEVGGVAQMMSDSFTQLGIAMLVAVAAVYLVMVLTFGEAIAPLAIMFSLPLAVIGGFIGLYLAGIPLDMPAMIGLLMLIGLVTTNAIMFIERVNQRLADGLVRRDALLDAGANRMRPILMTALTTIIALVPMASGIKDGALMSQSLAIVVVGGLTTSTLLTLIVVPVVYDLLESLKERILHLVPTQTPAPAEE